MNFLTVFLIYCVFNSVLNAPTKQEGIYSGFKYLINPEYGICEPSSNTNSPLIVAYIHTAPRNYKRRQLLRDTWLRRTLFNNIRVAFMLGATEDAQLTDKIQLESSIYNDLVQLDYKDEYHNLTYKGVYAMKWISKYCSNAQLVLKSDDDMVVNTFMLMKHLDYLSKYNLLGERNILCAKISGSPVVRDPNSLWYMSKEEYPDDTYLTYCSGSVFILSNYLPPLMYEESFKTKFFWIDDVFMTGILVRNLNVSIIDMGSMYQLEHEPLLHRFEKHADHTIFGHMSLFTLNERLYVWQLMLKRQLIKHPNEYLDGYLPDFEWSNRLRWS